MTPLVRRFVSSYLNSIASVLFVVELTAQLANAGSLDTPEGLKAGDSFRVIFVTSSTTNATSSDINYYDNFVNADANGITYQGAVVHWSAIGSTNTVNAINHIGTQAISGVYLSDGTKIASSTDTSAGGLWSGALANQPILGLDGTAYNNVNTWTGTSGNGVEYNTLIFGGYGLGSNNYGYDPYSQMNVFSTPQVQVGFVSSSQSGTKWIQITNISADDTPGLKSWTDQYQMYGISDVLTVCPEPSSLLISAIGIFFVAFRLKTTQN